ncbi:hypothetical protein D7X87_23175 [bacterium D16-54]|jgi:hypothetical protein|nr:hypothetical protein D7X87_23175 [bacterium D16-54]RKJ10785.1 hypothetical protein D7X65_22850 [bacterium D16-56]
MKSEQELFWEEVQKIQYSVVNVFLLKMSKYNDMSMLLNDVTYETIYNLMELIDGLRNINIKGEILNLPSGNRINSNIYLHDCCEEYLDCSDI